MKKFFGQKGRDHIGSILPWQSFQALQGEGKVCVDGKQLRFTKAR